MPKQLRARLRHVGEGGDWDGASLLPTLRPVTASGVRPLPWSRGQLHLVEPHLPTIQAHSLEELETTHETSAACKVFRDLNFPGYRSEFVPIQASMRRSRALPASMSYPRGLMKEGGTQLRARSNYSRPSLRSIIK